LKNGKDVTAKDLAGLFEITPRRIQILAKEGTLPRTEHGKYPHDDCIRSYCGYLRELAEGRFAKTELGAEKLVGERLENRKRAVAAAKAEGSVVALEDHEEVLGKLLGRMRGILLGIPGAWGSRVVGVPSPAEGLRLMTQLADEIVSGVAACAAEFDIEPPGPELIPDDFPGARQLKAAGIETMEALRGLDDFTIVKGIGPKTAEKMEEEVAA